MTGLRIVRLSVLIPVFAFGLCVVLSAFGYAALAEWLEQRGKTSHAAAKGISATLRSYLEVEGRPYELLQHQRTFTSMAAAEAAHVPGSHVAKTVLVKDDEGYLLAVIPATHRLLFDRMHERFGHDFGLAKEREMAALFGECETGAMPPFGEAYGLRVLVDDALLDQDEIYCASGNHAQLVHVAGPTFRALMSRAGHGPFSRPI